MSLSRARVAAPLAVAALAALPVAAAADKPDRPIVVRTDATAVAGPCSAAGVCRVDLQDGSFAGTPVGAGAFSGSLALAVAAATPNGEGGICAPLTGRLEVGRRLVVTLAGDSCQDGGGPLEGASFTGLARFSVKRDGRVVGRGLASLTEDAAHRHRMTLIGTLS